MNHTQMRLIDALVATKVNDWSNLTKTGKVSATNWYKTTGELTYNMRKYRPSIDPKQAIEAAQNVGAYTVQFVPGTNYQITMDPYAKISTGFIATGEGKTFALALCQAMLASFELMIEDYNAVDDLLEKDVVPQDGDIYPMCNGCSRPLKSKASQIRGYGPVCYEKLHGEEDEEQRNENHG